MVSCASCQCPVTKDQCALSIEQFISSIGLRPKANATYYPEISYSRCVLSDVCYWILPSASRPYFVYSRLVTVKDQPRQPRRQNSIPIIFVSCHAISATEPDRTLDHPDAMTMRGRVLSPDGSRNMSFSTRSMQGCRSRPSSSRYIIRRRMRLRRVACSTPASWPRSHAFGRRRPALISASN